MTTNEQDARFQTALEECVERVRRGEALETCLADYPIEYREELANFVPLAGRFSQLGSDPSPEFASRLEEHLLKSVDEARQRQRTRFNARLSRFFTSMPLMRVGVVLLIVIILAGGGAGVIQASDSSLPDSPLYNVKTVKEWAQLVLTPGAENQVNVRVQQILQRGSELEQAIRARKSKLVIDILAERFTNLVDRTVDQALEIKARGNPQPANRALVLIRLMQRQVDNRISEASPEARPSLQQLRVFLNGQEKRLLERGAIGNYDSSRTSLP